MKKNQDTLFSIKNEALKKERKYALLIMKTCFVFGVIAVISSIISLISLIFIPSDSLYTEVFEMVGITIPSLIITTPLLCLLLCGMWFLKFWSYPVMFLFQLTNYIISSSPSYTISSPYTHTASKFPLFTLLSLIAAWRVQAFLKKQKKSFLPEDKEENVDDINSTITLEVQKSSLHSGLSKNQESTMHNSFFALLKKKLFEGQKNTLFSIQNKELRKERRFSLRCMEVFFIFMFTAPLIIATQIFYTENFFRLIFYSISMILFFIAFWSAWRLSFLSYALVAGYMTLIIFACFISFYDYYYYYETYHAFQHYRFLFWIVSILTVIPAWRVRSFLLAHPEAHDTSTIQKEKWNKPFLAWFRDSLFYTKKDSLFFIRDKVLRKERIYSLLFMHIAFIIASVLFITIAINFFFEEGFFSLLFNCLCVLLLSIVLHGMWRLQPWAYIAIAIHSIGFMILGKDVRTGQNIFFLSLHFDSTYVRYWIFFIFGVIASWRVSSFLEDQADAPFTPEAKKITDDSTVDKRPKPFTEE